MPGGQGEGLGAWGCSVTDRGECVNCGATVDRTQSFVDPNLNPEDFAGT